MNTPQEYNESKEQKKKSTYPGLNAIHGDLVFRKISRIFVHCNNSEVVYETMIFFLEETLPDCPL
jgi:hypothetical protein